MTDSSSGSSAGPNTSGPQASPLDYLSTVLTRWRSVMYCALGAAVSMLILTFILPSTWTSEVIFLPVNNQTNPVQSALGSFASDLGVTLPAGSPTDAPEFYVALLKSRPIMEEVLLSKYHFKNDSIPLLDILEIDGDTPAERLENGRMKLDGIYTASSDRTTKVVTITVAAPEAGLAAAIAQKLVDLVDRFNKENRETQAGETRRFVEERLQETEKALKTAEDELEQFHTRNRRFDTPELQTQEARLQRQVQIQQTLYINLRQQYETARIQEVNDTPVLSVIEPAGVPVRKSFPRRGRLSIIALILGGFIGIGVAIGQNLTSNLEARHDPGYERFRAAWANLWREFRRIVLRRKD